MLSTATCQFPLPKRPHSGETAAAALHVYYIRPGVWRWERERETHTGALLCIHSTVYPPPPPPPPLFLPPLGIPPPPPEPSPCQVFLLIRFMLSIFMINAFPCFAVWFMLPSVSPDESTSSRNVATLASVAWTVVTDRCVRARANSLLL